MTPLLVALLTWIAAESGYSVPDVLPDVVALTPADFDLYLCEQTERCNSPMPHAEILAHFDFESRTIYMHQAFDPRDVEHQSAMVRQLVHFLQAFAGRSLGCPALLVQEAWQIENRWRAAHGLPLLPLTSLGVVLESCVAPTSGPDGGTGRWGHSWAQPDGRTSDGHSPRGRRANHLPARPGSHPTVIFDHGSMGPGRSSRRETLRHPEVARLFESRLDTNAPRAARAYALQAVAFHDVIVACWDAKYAYWGIRPFQLDPTLTTVFTTPNHPSYPAAHACLGGAMETVLGHLFPRDAAHFTRLADDESWSRLWAGIHFRSDIEAGRALGRAVGAAVVERAKRDGAE